MQPMSRKFIHLEVGQEFLFEKISYAKASALTARNLATGEQRFMSRSAEVETPACLREPPPAAAPVMLPALEVERVWRHFLAQWTHALACQPDAAAREALQSTLTAASAEFERSLGLGNGD